MNMKKEREKFARKLLKFTRDLYLGKCIRIKYINDCLEPTDIGIKVDDIVLGNSKFFGQQAVLFMSKEVILYDRNSYQISPINMIAWSIKIPDAGYEEVLEFTSMEVMSELDFNNDLKDSVAYLKNYLNIAKQIYLGKSLKVKFYNSSDVKYGRLSNITVNPIDSRLVFIWDEVIFVGGNSVWFDKDQKGVKGNDLHLEIIKYPTPITTIEYSDIEIIPDAEYNKLKEKYTSLMIEKYAKWEHITKDYMDNLEFDLDGNIVKGRLIVS